MTSLWITLCKPFKLEVDNRWLSTGSETTKLKDVLGDPSFHTGSTHIHAGSEVVNPQSTALITVIRYIEGSSHPTITVSGKPLHIMSEAKP